MAVKYLVACLQIVDAKMGVATIMPTTGDPFQHNLNSQST